VQVPRLDASECGGRSEGRLWLPRLPPEGVCGSGCGVGVGAAVELRDGRGRGRGSELEWEGCGVLTEAPDRITVESGRVFR
jgi:hypothetical protein